MYRNVSKSIHDVIVFCCEGKLKIKKVQLYFQLCEIYATANM